MIYQPTLSGIEVLKPTKQARSVLLFGLSGALTVCQLRSMPGFDEIQCCFVWYEALGLNVPVIEIMRPRAEFQVYLASRGFRLSNQCRSMIDRTLKEQRTQLKRWLGVVGTVCEQANGARFVASDRNAVPCTML